MKKYLFSFLIILALIQVVNSQNIDTLVDVGGYNIHFNIIKGEGTPILFEAGAGNDGSVWNNILYPIYETTGATLITYDRSGFGKSELNPHSKNESDFGIVNGIKELEAGLSILGYDDEIILVSHSYGGLYNLLYAHKHSEKVKSVILIDAVLNDFWNEDLLSIRDTFVVNFMKTIDKHSGMYYLMVNYKETARYMRNIQFPDNIPIVDIVAEIYFPNVPDEFRDRRLYVHEKKSKRKNVSSYLAYDCRHYIFIDNPSFITYMISKAYSETVNEERKLNILEKLSVLAINNSNDSTKSKYSEEEINSWGYRFLRNGELELALKVFELNVLLYPESWNVYDSYGEALMNANRNEEAIKMYEKSIELNPDNENGKKMIEEIKLRE